MRDYHTVLHQVSSELTGVRCDSWIPLLTPTSPSSRLTIYTKLSSAPSSNLENIVSYTHTRTHTHAHTHTHTRTHTCTVLLQGLNGPPSTHQRVSRTMCVSSTVTTSLGQKNGSTCSLCALLPRTRERSHKHTHIMTKSLIWIRCACSLSDDC